MRGLGIDSIFTTLLNSRMESRKLHRINFGSNNGCYPDSSFDGVSIEAGPRLVELGAKI
jgi:hypothetical protein